MEHERQFTRIPLPYGAELVVDGVRYRAREGGNVSATGVFLPVADGPAPGTTGALRIPLAGAEVRATGTVVRSDAGGLAAHFTALDGEGLALLLNLVRYNAEDPDAAEREFAEHLSALLEP